MTILSDKFPGISLSDDPYNLFSDLQQDSHSPQKFGNKTVKMHILNRYQKPKYFIFYLSKKRTNYDLIVVGVAFLQTPHKKIKDGKDPIMQNTIKRGLFN